MKSVNDTEFATSVDEGGANLEPCPRAPAARPVAVPSFADDRANLCKLAKPPHPKAGEARATMTGGALIEGTDKCLTLALSGCL